MSTTLLPVIAGRATTEGEMEKIESLYMADGCCRTTDEMLASKLNEIVEWINEISKWIGQVNKDWVEVQKWINKQVGGEKKESRGEEINRLLKNKPECEWGPGGSMTQNEKHSQKR